MVAKLSRRHKLAYGVGDLGFSLTLTIIGVYFVFFLIDVVGLRPAVAAIPFLIGETWDYINDPLFGHLSDRTRSRWGRRRPYLLFGALPLAVTFAMLWWRPPLDGTVALVVYYSLAYVLFEAAATLTYMPYFALTPELTDDYDERTALTSYRMVFSILGGLVAFTLPLMMVGAFNPDNASRVLLMGVVFGVVAAVPLVIVFLGTRERAEYAEASQTSLWRALRAAWQNRPFRYGLGMYLAAWISLTSLQAILLIFIKHVLHREARSDLFMGTIFVTAVLALPLWVWVSKRWGKRSAYIYGIAFWAAVQLVLITLTPTSPVPLIVLLCLLAGIGVAAAHVIPWSIIPDTVEWDEWHTGERHEGMLYSLVSLGHKAAAASAVAGALLLLDLTGYVSDAAQQSPATLIGIRLVVGPLPAILLIIGILIAIGYPLNRSRHQQMVADLKLRRAAGKG